MITGHPQTNQHEINSLSTQVDPSTKKVNVTAPETPQQQETTRNRTDSAAKCQLQLKTGTKNTFKLVKPNIEIQYIKLIQKIHCTR